MCPSIGVRCPQGEHPSCSPDAYFVTIRSEDWSGPASEPNTAGQRRLRNWPKSLPESFWRVAGFHSDHRRMSQTRDVTRAAQGGPVRRVRPVAVRPANGKHSGHSSDHPVLELQAQVGNQAVTSLMAIPVQRQPKFGGAPRSTAGWDNADTAADGTPGWNAAARDNVAGSGIRRIPVDNIAAGNQREWSATNEKPADDAQSEKNRTTETAAGRAIVLKPAGLDVNKPIDALLHLHGYTSRRWDPAAGWRQAKVGDHQGRQVLQAGPGRRPGPDHPADGHRHRVEPADPGAYCRRGSAIPSSVRISTRVPT